MSVFEKQLGCCDSSLQLPGPVSGADTCVPSPATSDQLLNSIFCSRLTGAERYVFNECQRDQMHSLLASKAMVKNTLRSVAFEIRPWPCLATGRQDQGALIRSQLCGAWQLKMRAALMALLGRRRAWHDHRRCADLIIPNWTPLDTCHWPTTVVRGLDGART